MKYNDFTLGQIEAIMNKIGGEYGIKQLLSGETRIVEKERPKPPAPNRGVDFASRLDTAKFLAEWQRFYQEVFGVTVDFSNVTLPPVISGFNWGVAVASGMTAERIVVKMCKSFKVSKPSDYKHCYEGYKDLDDLGLSKLSKEKPVRSDDKPYVIWVRDNIEPGEELKSFVPIPLVHMITLREQLLLELWFNWRSSGKHLEGMTDCWGSTHMVVNFNSSVPMVEWKDDVLCISFCSLMGSGNIHAPRVRWVISAENQELPMEIPDRK